MMTMKEFKAKLAEIPDHRPEELDVLVIQWLREGSKEFGPYVEKTMDKLLNAAATLMEVEA